MLPLPLLGEVLEIAAVAVSGVAGVKGIVDAIAGLRAKRKARQALSDPANPTLASLAKTSGERALNDEELKQAADAILHSLRDEPDEVQRQVRRGLTQPSRSAERRYIEDLLSPTAPTQGQASVQG